MHLLKRLSSSTQDIGLEISGPSELKHLVHVDRDLSWNFDESIDAKAIFEKIRVIGKGGFGTVVELLHKPSGLNLAGKMLSKEMVSRATKESLKKEIDLMKRIRTPYTISYYGNVIFEDSQTILMEFCQCGSLRDIMDDNGPKTLNETQIKCVMYDLLNALKRLHTDFQIIHRDIKAGNILLSKSGRLKISDFGVSRQFDSKNISFSTTSIVGTPYWMAPEVINGLKYSFSADVWSVGATAIELFESIPPYSEFPIMRAMVLIATQGFQGFRENSKPTPVFEDFIRKCMVVDPALRSSVDDLLLHPFLKDVETINRQEVFKDLLTHEVTYNPPKEEEEEDDNDQEATTTNTTEITPDNRTVNIENVNNDDEDEEIIIEEEEEEELNDDEKEIRTIDFSKVTINPVKESKQPHKINNIETMYISNSENQNPENDDNEQNEQNNAKEQYSTINKTEEVPENDLQLEPVENVAENVIQNDNNTTAGDLKEENQYQTINISNVEESEKQENVSIPLQKEKIEKAIKEAAQNLNIPDDPKVLAIFLVSALVLCYSFGGKFGVFSMALLLAVLYYGLNYKM